MDKRKVQQKTVAKKENQKKQEPVVADKRNLAFGKINFTLLAAGVVVVLLGLFLMAGGESTEKVFDPSIFDPIHIKVAPIVTLIGFVSIIFAILIKPKDR